MSHDTAGAAPEVPRLPAVSPKQDRALAALLEGATDDEAAKRAGVRRETVNRWRHGDADFVAELNRRRAEAWAGQIDALRALLPSAVKALEAGLKAPDIRTRVKTAELLLRTLQVGSEPLRPPSQHVSPDEVREHWRDEAEAKAAGKQMRAMLDGGLSAFLPGTP